MRKDKSLKVNFLMNTALTVSSFVFPLISFPYISRVLEPDGIGRVSFATSLVSYFVLLANLGIPNYGIRAVAQVRDNREELSRTAHELLVINLCTGTVSCILLFCTVFAVPRLQEDRTLYLIMSSSILLNAIGMEWLYKGLEEYSYITVRSIIFKALALAGMFALIHSPADYVIYGAITIFSSYASFILNFFNARKYVSFSKNGKYNYKRHLKPVFVFFAMSCAITVYTHLDTVMLGWIKTSRDVGYYTVAVKVKGVLTGLVASLGAVLLPRVSYYMETGQEEAFERIIKKSLNFTVLAAAPLMVYFMLYAEESIYVLSGPAYKASILPMQIIMPTLLLIGLTNCMGMQIMVPSGREKLVLYSVLTGAVVDIILNAILIPKMASAGAAAGTLVAEAAVFVFQFFAIKQQERTYFKGISFVKILPAVLCGAAASFWIKGQNWNQPQKLILSAVIYFAVYIFVLAVLKETLTVETIRAIRQKIRAKV